jgi:hypothetical protein
VRVQSTSQHAPASVVVDENGAKQPSKHGDDRTRTGACATVDASAPHPSADSATRIGRAARAAHALHRSNARPTTHRGPTMGDKSPKQKNKQRQQRQAQKIRKQERTQAPRIPGPEGPPPAQPPQKT